MFEFLSMIGNYGDRKVDQFFGEKDNLMISTAFVTDGRQTYETAICHDDYNNGKHVIVEGYDTKGEAQKGHNKWKKIMTAKNLPSKLVDCDNANIMGEQQVFKKKRSK